MAAADLLLHPVRLRIVQQFLGDARLTTAEVCERLPDVPVASVYRHIGRLVDGGVLTIVDERRVRGAIERTLALEGSAAVVGPDEAARMTVEEHRQGFMTFVAGLLADFDRYLDRPRVDLARDLVGYRQVGLHLTDTELEELLLELSAAVAARLGNEPSGKRQLRVLTTIVMPGPDS